MFPIIEDRLQHLRAENQKADELIRNEEAKRDAAVATIVQLAAAKQRIAGAIQVLTEVRQAGLVALADETAKKAAKPPAVSSAKPTRQRKPKTAKPAANVPATAETKAAQ